MHPQRIQPGPGQESVWDYPRPPRLEPTTRHIVVRFAGVTIAESRYAWRVLETSHPPVYYIPPDDVRRDFLVQSSRSSFCEWKGRARYFTVQVGDREARDAAWSYPDPTPLFASIHDHVAFYADLMDVCTVNGESVTPQPGGFYGGWITPDLVGPFKGEPGTMGW